MSLEAQQLDVPPLLLIDADVLRYRIGFVCQHKMYYVFMKDEEQYGPLLKSKDKDKANEFMEENEGSYVKEFIIAEHISKCLHTVKLQIEAILKKFPGSDYKVFLSGKDNFRDTLVDYYKANRDRSTRPLHFQNITDYLINHWGAEVIDGIEADDALGIAQMEQYHYDMGNVHETCIVTIDKDLDCVPGLHYNFVKDDLYELTPEEAMTHFYTQMITGDTADNIPGLYKITGIRALAKIHSPLASMSKELDMWHYVVNVYQAACAKKEVKMSMEELITKLTEIGQLLWIWHKKDNLWQPPSTKNIPLMEVPV